MNNVVVSVIIPVYNVPEVTTAITSCTNQSFRNIEIIIVDDGSESYIGEKIRAIHDPRIRYIRCDQNTNANVCRNIGIDAAKGRYVAFLDSDDLYIHNHIMNCLDCLKANQADGLYGSIIIHDGKVPREIHAELPQREEKMVNYLLRKGYGACTSTLFLSKESASAIQWDETLQRHQDYDFLVRYANVYHLTINHQATVIYNAESGKIRAKGIDFYSCIRFTEANKEDISPALYRQYVTGMLNLARHLNAGSEIIEYYQKELK